ncbi:MAG: ABC transporter ATP-binding protein [Colwellia sp.]
MSVVINIEKVNKSYKKQQVLNDLNWQINQGDVIGLLGKNGVGKSTLLKGLLNINEIDSGSITIFGENYQHLTAQTKGKIGYVPQENDEISWLSVRDLIKFRKQFYQQWSDEKVTELISRWQIDEKKTIAELSPGQVQRVLIILALAPMPELIVFDEPAAALDPAARREFLKEIVLLASKDNITIIFSTHIVSDLERVANKVAILDKGNICYFEDLDTTKENVVQLSISYCKSYEQTDEKIEVPYLLRSKSHGQGQHCVTSCIVSNIDQSWLIQMQKQGLTITVTPMGLEDIFLELTV